jgi:hypothetical protein
MFTPVFLCLYYGFLRRHHDSSLEERESRRRALAGLPPREGGFPVD